MKILNVESMKEAIGSEIAIIDFFAPWCKPCVNFGPIFEKVAIEFAQKANFYKVDIEETPSIAADYDILSIPAILVFAKGIEVERKFGSMPEIDFRIWLNATLNKIATR